jgi:hypothetical protein
MGEWMVIEPWQYESIYKIYNNDGSGDYLPEIELKVGKTDAAALALAFVEAEKHGGERRKRQFATLKAQGRSWQQIARLASYIEQVRNLELQPHEVPPCWVIDPDHPDRGEEAAAKLVRELRKAGVSQLSPEPHGGPA